MCYILYLYVVIYIGNSLYILTFVESQLVELLFDLFDLMQ